MSIYEYELGLAAERVVRELFRLQAGETLVITGDTESDWRVINATARSAFAAGGRPMVVLHPSPQGVGKAADPLLPLEPLAAALGKADCWAEYNNQWLLYSTPYDRAFQENKRLRHLNLVGMNASMMVRCIGRVDFAALEAFQKAFSSLLGRTRHVRIATPAGEDVEFRDAEGKTL